MSINLLLPAATAGAAAFYVGHVWIASRAGLAVASPIERARRGARPINDAIRAIATGQRDAARLRDDLDVRVATLETIVTDPGVRLSHEIDALRNTAA